MGASQFPSSSGVTVGAGLSGTGTGADPLVNSGALTAFPTIAVSGQSDIVADRAADTLTVAAGANITLTTNAGTDTLTIAAGAGTPGGSTTQVQFNDAGSLGGDAGLTYVKATDTLVVSGALGVGAAPSYPLDVRNALSVVQILSTTGTNSAFIRFTNDVAAFLGLNDSTGGGILSGGLPYSFVINAQASDRAVQIGTANTARLIILPAGNVGIGTTSPHAKALLDLTSTTMGFLPPRMTTTQRDAITGPPAGLLIYNTTTAKLNVYTTAWEVVTSL